MGGDNLISIVIISLFVILIISAIVAVVFLQSRKSFREQKSYERGLKMVPILIHLPPPSDDIDVGSRDARDVADEVISQAQTMYNVITSTATKGFKSKFYGQRHISFELIASGGLIRYYVVVPTVLVEVIKQSVVAAYPMARLEEVEEINLFSEVGKISGTIGGEFSLKKEYSFPIATYQESKRDATRAILNALATSTREDGVGIQVLLRPADESWTKTVEKRIRMITEGRKGAASGRGGGSNFDWSYIPQMLEVLWKPPSSSKDKPQDTSGATTDKQLSGADKEKVDAMEEKMRYAGYEVLVRVVASSSTASRSQALLSNIVSAFSLFDSPTKNGFTFTPARDIEHFVTSYIMRFFPAEINSNILNTVELATIFHLPDQNNIPSSQVERQGFKQVDGPSQALDEGLLLGYNIFRGTKKPIRISQNDRRRHIYIMGGTGMGKSVLLENLALQNMLDGKGFAFVDPHGDTAENLLAMVPKERVEDVIYFDPSDMSNPVGLNLFEIDPQDPDPERTKDYIVAEVMNMLYSLYDPGHTGIVGPRMENIVRNAALLLMSDPAGGTFMDIPKVLVDPDFAKSKLPYLTNQRAIDFWTKEWPAAQRSNDAGEVTSWVVSKWASFENAMMSNILGQTRSGLNLREIMDNRKILLVNLSKGKMGEMPAKLLGMVFVMKFQAAAMSRANIPEDEREDFTLFVDEFQNFATDSFESILSEARKYRLSLIVANQFMTQLTDKIRSAIIGNAGSFIIGRVGYEDAEQVGKMFAPVFDVEDMQRMPNYTAICKLLISGMPSNPFTMSLIPPMGHPNQQLADALTRLSAAKYGRPRAEVELEIHNRLNAAQLAREKDKQARLEAMRNAPMPSQSQSINANPSNQNQQTKPKENSFLDDWLAKRQETSKSNPNPNPNPQNSSLQKSPTPPKQRNPAKQDSQPDQIKSQQKTEELLHDKPNSANKEQIKQAQEPVAAPIENTNIAPPKNPNENPKSDNIAARSTKSETEIETEISETLREAKSKSISEMTERKIIQANANELKIGGSKSGDNEIFVNLHDRNS